MYISLHEIAIREPAEIAFVGMNAIVFVFLMLLICSDISKAGSNWPPYVSNSKIMRFEPFSFAISTLLVREL